MTASRRPKASAAASVGGDVCNLVVVRWLAETSSGSATGTPPGTASHRRPAASTSKNPTGASDRLFTKVMPALWHGSSPPGQQGFAQHHQSCGRSEQAPDECHRTYGCMVDQGAAHERA